ncbi:MAG: hypothetical protein GVY02_01110 [Bacteroidetes bacterium]|jgi:hypothetical protein|nr:hypothetical protein [Bacteroidota bacterium]
MALIDRSDLKYDYDWGAQPAEAPRTSTLTEDEPESKVFRTEDGVDVLTIINEYAEEHDIEDKDEALVIEMLLKNELNEENMTKDEVKVWIKRKMDTEHV